MYIYIYTYIYIYMCVWINMYTYMHMLNHVGGISASGTFVHSYPSLFVWSSCSCHSVLPSHTSARGLEAFTTWTCFKWVHVCLHHICWQMLHAVSKQIKNLAPCNNVLNCRQIHHDKNTSPQQYITATIHRNKNASTQQFSTTTIHHRNNTSSVQNILIYNRKP